MALKNQSLVEIIEYVYANNFVVIYPYLKSTELHLLIQRWPIYLKNYSLWLYWIMFISQENHLVILDCVEKLWCGVKWKINLK